MERRHECHAARSVQNSWPEGSQAGQSPRSCADDPDQRHTTRRLVRAVRDAVGADFPVGIRISQGKVNDFTHKWREGADGATTVFATLASAGVDFFHVTEFEAWRPAFGDTGDTFVSLARRAAPGLSIIANGSLHDPARATLALADGADIVALGRGALANPDWPRLISSGMTARELDAGVLSPLGDIKPVEINIRTAL